MSEQQPKKPSKAQKKLPKTQPVKDKQAKSTKAEVYQRVSEVQTLLLQGYTRSYMLQYASKWKVSDRMVDEYIAQANINIKEVSRAGLESDLAILVSAMWDTFRAAKAANNIGEQRQTLVAIAKLKGLDETRVNHIIDDKREMQDLSDADLDAILAQDQPGKH